MKWLMLGIVVILCGVGAALGLIDLSPKPAVQGQLNGQLIITGSSTVSPLVEEIARRFEQIHPGVEIDVQSGGSSRGISDARRGTADIGMASRALSDEESDLFGHTIARDGVCMIVHDQNKIESLDNDQVRAIYTGKLENWSQLGGSDRGIYVVNKAAGHATLEVFLKHFELKNPQIHPDVVISSNEEGIKTVIGNKDAIGYVSIGTAEYYRQQGQPLKLLSSNGVKASTKTLADGTFPISRPLNVVTKTEPTGLTKAFIDYCQSEEVHDLIASQYFVPSTN